MPRDSSNSSVERTSDPRRRRSQPSAAPPPAPPPARTEPELDPPPKASTSRIPSSTAESSSTRHHPYHSNSRREDEKGQRKPAPYLTIHPENPDLLLQADPWHTTELDGLDSDPDDEVLEALENPSGPVNLKGYDNEDSSDDD
ncbi:uncharacterized protein JCM6883_004333 [Sporobolomyces salmoneus]|uniref:uncharacterized protein n=1 Tax=Sporobolomyces salmoneus TaxID=183962 RepID=UPI00317397FF